MRNPSELPALKDLQLKTAPLGTHIPNLLMYSKTNKQPKQTPKNLVLASFNFFSMVYDIQVKLFPLVCSITGLTQTLISVKDKSCFCHCFQLHMTVTTLPENCC